MRPKIFALAFILLPLGLSASAQSPGPAGSSPLSILAPAPCTANCPQTPAKPPTANPGSPAKPPAKPHKVYTNEDIDARPHDITIEGTRDLLQQLNTCDRTCFDQVAQRAGPKPKKRKTSSDLPTPATSHRASWLSSANTNRSSAIFRTV